ncbi:MAG: MlaD family protein [Alistipes sp.]
MRREVKIGLFTVLMIGCAWAGIRFLSGIDIFSRNNEYYAAYDQINGVQPASPIMIKGVKVGTVTGITFDPERSEMVVLRFSIKRQYQIPTNSEAKIFSNSIMGAKAVEIHLGDAKQCLESGDTLRSSRDRDLMDMAGSELDFFKQKVSQITTDLSRTLQNINTLLEANTVSLTGTMTNIHGITGNLNGLLASERSNLQTTMNNLTRFSNVLGNNAQRMDSIVGNVNTLTARLSDEQFTANLAGAVGELNAVLAKIDNGEGTVGSLINDRALYVSLTEASNNLSALLADLETNPKRYVHFSLFGRSEAKEQAKAAKKAAKVAAKAERDSLRSVR